MKKKIFLSLNIIFIVAVLISAVCYAIYGGLWLKALTSSGFVALGIVNLIYAILTKTNKLNFVIFMFIGLVFSMAGDVVLNIKDMFIYGAILFAIAHVFYFVAYCFIAKFKWIDLGVGACIFVPAILVVTLVPMFNFGGVLMEVVCAIYALIISLMLGKSISNLFRERNLTNLLLVVGSFLFFFSDLMLLFNVFGSGLSQVAKSIFDNFCLGTYFPAQCVLGFTLFLTAQKAYINSGHN